MREKLNENPMMQLAVIGVLLLVAGVFVMSSMGGSGGGGGESESESESGEGATAAAVSETAAEPPAGVEAALAMVSRASARHAPLPHDVTAAWKEGKTVVLLFVHDGGIDDKLVKAATDSLASLPQAKTFVVSASKISRYAAITEGVGVNRVPALVVVRPKDLHQTIPTASVSYGFQTGASVEQAVIDAGYKGPTLDYHP